FTLIHFFSPTPPPTEIYTLSLHDALPICRSAPRLPAMPSATVARAACCEAPTPRQAASRSMATGSSSARRLASRRSSSDGRPARSEEHTSELQSQSNLVCRLLLEKKKKKK